MGEEPLSQEDMELLESMGVGVPKPTEKTGLFDFFNKILKRKDTTKVANIDLDELNSVRTLQNGALFATVGDYDEVCDYFRAKGETILATSDSKDGFLIRAAITTKRELATSSKAMKENKGWFKKKEEKNMEVM